jgi:hypothetical protein
VGVGWIVSTTMGSPGEDRALLDDVGEHVWRPGGGQRPQAEEIDSAARRLLRVSDPPPATA